MSDDRGWIVAFYSRSQKPEDRVIYVRGIGREVCVWTRFGRWDVGPSPTAARHALMRRAEFSDLLFDGRAVVAAVEFMP